MDEFGLVQLRRCVQCASSWVYERHYKSIMSMPWIVGALPDYRRPFADRLKMAQEIVGVGTEMLDEWFGEELVSRVETPEELMDEKMFKGIWTWSWQVLLTNAGSEHCHARNRRRAHESANWSNFAAHSFNQETMLRLERQRGASEQCGPTHKRKRKQKDEVQKPKQSQRRARKPSAHDVFRAATIRSLQDQGCRPKVASAEFAQYVKEEWAEVSQNPDRLQLYCAMAEQKEAGQLALKNEAEATPQARVGPTLAAPALARAAIEDITGGVDVEQGIAKRVPALAMPSHCTFPVDPRVLTQVAQRSGKLEAMYASMEKDFAKLHNTFATPGKPRAAPAQRLPRWTRTPHGAFPARVLLGKKIGAFAQTAAKPFKLADMPWAQLLIKMEVQSNDDQTLLTQWLAGASGNSQAGPVPMRVHFTLCSEVGVCANGDVELAYARQPMFPTKQLSFGGRVDCGMFQHLSFQDVAAKALEHRCGSKILLSKQRWHPLCGDGLVVVGDHPEGPNETVVIAELQEKKLKGRALEAAAVGWGVGILPPRAPQPRKAAQLDDARPTSFSDHLHVFFDAAVAKGPECCARSC